MMQIRFADPAFLAFILLLPVLYWWIQAIRRRRKGALRFSDLGNLKKIPVSRTVRMRHVVLLLRFSVLLILILAAARPQSTDFTLENDYTEGVDILIALDCSGSMQAMDLDYKKRNRLEVAKEVTEKFIGMRRSDRIGLVVFAGDAYTQCPMTLDYGVLKEILKNVTITMNQTIPDGTAIGMAVARCLKRLENSEAKSRVIVLLTDGVHNAGEIDPLTAANMAKIQGVKIYSVGVGSRSGVAPILQQHPLFGSTWVSEPVQLDEKTLEAMATTTGGKYFRAGDDRELHRIFEEIDQLEKTKIEDLGEHRYKELFIWFTALALVLLCLEVILGQTIFRVLP